MGHERGQAWEVAGSTGQGPQRKRTAHAWETADSSRYLDSKERAEPRPRGTQPQARLSGGVGAGLRSLQQENGMVNCC